MPGIEALFQSLPPGHGRVSTSLASDGRVSLTEFASSYPLKLVKIDPRATPATLDFAFDHVGCVYMLAYGGGIVSGDSVAVDFHVGDGTALVVLTQGNTKVFRRRVESESGVAEDVSLQRITASIESGATLLLLPDPVAGFRSSAFRQRQRFGLHDQTSGLVLLDWFTSGRSSVGERWDFDLYESTIEVHVGGQNGGAEGASKETLWFREAVLLQKDSSQGHGDGPASSTAPSSSFATRTGFRRFDCFATLFAAGEGAIPVVGAIEAAWEQVVIGGGQSRGRGTPMRGSATKDTPKDLEWSVSALPRFFGDTTGARSSIPGLVVRIGGDSVETVRHFIRDTLLSRLHEVAGQNWFARHL